MMTAIDFRVALARLGLKQKEFAEKVGFDPATICRYARGKKPVPHVIEHTIGIMLERTQTP